jgi:tripartite ATP-independent transporter DctM subunit
MIVYGLMTEVSVGHLFIAGIGPGILLVVLFSLYVIGKGILTPQAAPRAAPATWRERFASLKGVIPFLVIMLLITGSIYTGIATPTEAAATSVVIAILVSVAYGRFSRGVLTAALLETVAITGFITLLITGAKIFSFFLAIKGVPQEMTTLLVNMFPNSVMLVAAMMLLYLILGALMDPLGMMVLTIPAFFPVLMAMGVDPVLFGVLLVIQVELAVITPPVGITTYVIAGAAEPYGVTITECFRGIIPFAAIMALSIAILLAFPAIALWLPSSMLSR